MPKKNTSLKELFSSIEDACIYEEQDVTTWLAEESECDIKPDLTQELSEKKNGSIHLKENETGRLFPVGKALLIGSSPSCDVVIEDSTVSRKHALIEEKDGKLYVTDCSTNGTYIAEGGKFKRLPKGSIYEVKEGQSIRFSRKGFVLIRNA